MAFVKFESFLTDVAAGNVHDLTVDSLGVFLTNQAPDPTTNSVKADFTEVAVGGGYAGAVTLTITSRGITGGEYVITPSGPYVWTGTGSGFGPLQYAVLYNVTEATNKLIGYWDYPSAITVVSDGETLTLNVTAADGLLKLI